MIHDATVEVTCDGNECWESADVPLPYVYSTGGVGRYDDAEEKIEARLVKEHHWIVSDGSHYCSERCQSMA